MKSLTLMLIAGVALPIAAIAQTTPTTPPADTMGNVTAVDPAVTTTDATANTTATTTDSAANTPAAEPDPADTKAKKKKKKPMDAAEPRL